MGKEKVDANGTDVKISLTLIYFLSRFLSGLKYILFVNPLFPDLCQAHQCKATPQGPPQSRVSTIGVKCVLAMWEIIFIFCDIVI